MILWVLEKTAAGELRNVVHLAHVLTKPDYSGAQYAITLCGQGFVPGEWVDAELSPWTGTLPLVCRECAGVTVQDAWEVLRA